MRGSVAEAAGGPRGWAWSRGHAPHPGDTHWLAGPHPGRTCRLESLDVSAAPAVRRTRGRGRGRSAPRRQVPPGWRPGRVRRRRGRRGPRGAPESEGGTRVRGGRYEAGSERGFGRPPLPSAESPDAGGRRCQPGPRDRRSPLTLPTLPGPRPGFSSSDVHPEKARRTGRPSWPLPSASVFSSRNPKASPQMVLAFFTRPPGDL